MLRKLFALSMFAVLATSACSDANMAGAARKQAKQAGSGSDVDGDEADDEGSGSGKASGSSADGGADAGLDSGASSYPAGSTVNVADLLPPGAKVVGGESSAPEIARFDPVTGTIELLTPGNATIEVRLDDGTTETVDLAVAEPSGGNEGAVPPPAAPAAPVVGTACPVAQFGATLAEIKGFLPPGSITSCKGIVRGKEGFRASSGCQRACATRGFNVGFMAECGGADGQSVICQCAGNAANPCVETKVVPVAELAAKVPPKALVSCQQAVGNPQNFPGTSACNRWCASAGYIGGGMNECDGTTSPGSGSCACAKPGGSASIEEVDLATVMGLLPAGALSSCKGAVHGEQAFPANSGCGRLCASKGKSFGRMIECDGGRKKAACLCL